MTELELDFEPKGRLKEEILGNMATCYHRTPTHFDLYPTCPWSKNNPANAGLTDKQLAAKKAANPNWQPTPADVTRFEILPNCWRDEALTGQATPALLNTYGSDFKPSWGFRAGNGKMYGVGMYSTFRDPRQNTQTRGYGGLIIKFGIHNMSNYLFTDFEQFKKTPRYLEHPKLYNENNYLIKQLIEAGVPAPLFAKFESKCSFEISGREIIEHYGRHNFAWDFAPYFLGFVYTGGNNDGDVLVTFDIKAMESSSVRGKMSDEDEETKAAYAAVYKRDITKQRLNNIQTLYPLGFSIDGGKTYHPIPIGPTSKKRIANLNKQFAMNRIQYIYDKSFKNTSGILKNYIQNGRAYIPAALIDCGYVKRQDLENSITNDASLDIVVPTIAKNSTYDMISEIIENTNRKGAIIKFSSNLFNEQEEKVKRAEGFDGFCRLVLSLNKLYIDTSDAGSYSVVMNPKASIIPTLLTKNISKFVLGKFIVRAGGLEDLKGKQFKARIAVIDIADPNMALASSIFPGAYIIVTHRMEDLIEYFKWNEVNDGKDWERNKAARRDFEAAKLSGRKMVINQLSEIERIKFWDGIIEISPTLSWRETQPDAWSEMRKKTKALILNKLVISPTKDSITGRSQSFFPADKKVGIRNLSIIGWNEPLGNDKTSIQRCGCDLKAFESIRNYMYVENYLGLYLPDTTTARDITEELIDSIKFCADKNAAIHIYYRGDDSQVDTSSLSPEYKSWWNKHARSYSEAIFSKYIDNPDPVTRIEPDQVEESDDDILYSIAAEAD